MQYFKLISVLLVIFLLAGCLTPRWEEGESPPIVGAASVDVEEIPEEELLFEDVIDEDLPVKEVKAGQLVSFPHLQADDPDGDEIHYTFSEPLNDAGEWQTAEGDEGEYVVTITASDGQSTISQKVKIVVNPSNFAPEITIEGTITIREGDILTLDAVVEDEDNDDVSIRYEGWVEDLPYNISFTDAGIHTITIVASDGKKETRKDVDIIVENVNRPPQITAINDTVVVEYDTVIIVPDVIDPDGDDVIVSVSGPFTEGVWQTTAGDAGEYEIKVEATDGEYIVDSVFILTVLDFDDFPVIEADDVTVKEGEVVKLDITATDPEGEDITLTISGWMDGLEKQTGFEDAGRHKVIIKASDGVKVGKKVIYVTVEDVNRAPVFNANAFN